MRFKYIHILAAVFLVIGMTVQTFVSYRYARKHVQIKLDLQMQLVQEKLRFELYDAYDVAVQLEDFVSEMDNPDDLMEETRSVIKHYPQFYSCYVAFSENRFPKEGKWYCPCSYRVGDTIYTIDFGDAKHDYFAREWYHGAVNNEAGFWSQPYRDEDYKEMIFTYSYPITDVQGNVTCVIASDFSVKWLQARLNADKPFDEAVFVLHSTNGEPIAASDEGLQITDNGEWLISSTTLKPIDLDLMIAVPRSFVWAGISWGIWIQFTVFLLGIILVGVLIRRLWLAREESVKLNLIERDMQIANQIQMGILPKDAYNDEHVALKGTLIPMREVGGDLYDYHKEGDCLWFIIGDVSGKGVPAAMFMSATVNLFRAAGRRLNSPKAIMEEMNVVLSDNNPSFTFVTAFIGRLDCQTGKMTYCNAGHCEPIIKGKGFVVCEPNIPLGYNGNFEFKEQETSLAPGDTLVLYTDGVTEARDAQHRMLGKAWWMEIVEHREDLPEAVKNYIGKADPTDDITLMTIRHQRAVQPLTLRVPTREDQWPVLRHTIHEYGTCLGIEPKALKKLEVAAEEAVVNILHYSQAGFIEMALSVHPSPSSLHLVLTDDGLPFDPTAYETKAEAVAERQVGGLGISLIRQIADEVHYERIQNTNNLTIIKQL